MKKELPRHLGGHANKTWLDRGALEYLVNVFNIQSMLDIGCGPGGMVKMAIDMGIPALGVDGDFTLDFGDLPIRVHDFNSGKLALDHKFDLCWSVEFLEHIEEQYLPNVFAAMRSCKCVCCTASTLMRGAGHKRYHKNCQPREYWIEQFSRFGFRYVESCTKAIAQHSTMAPNKYLDGKNFIQATGMFFVNMEEALAG